MISAPIVAPATVSPRADRRVLQHRAQDHVEFLVRDETVAVEHQRPRNGASEKRREAMLLLEVIGQREDRRRLSDFEGADGSAACGADDRKRHGGAPYAAVSVRLRDRGHPPTLSADLRRDREGAEDHAAALRRERAPGPVRCTALVLLVGDAFDFRATVARAAVVAVGMHLATFLHLQKL